MDAIKSTALNLMQDTLAWTPLERLSFNATMSLATSRKVGIALRTARKRRGLVMRQLADAAGVTTGAVGNWERGANDISMDNLRTVAGVLKVDVAALAEGEVRFLEDPTGTTADAEIITEPGPPPRGPLDVEILGVAAGGDDGDFTLNGEVTGYVRRPPGITNLRRVFALHVISDSMSPRYEPGELVYCGGREAVAGDHIVIEMFPQDDELVGKAYIKKLLRRSKGEIVCQQYNPQQEVRFDAYRVKNLWRIIPLGELVGF